MMIEKRQTRTQKRNVSPSKTSAASRQVRSSKELPMLKAKKQTGRGQSRSPSKSSNAVLESPSRTKTRLPLKTLSNPSKPSIPIRTSQRTSDNASGKSMHQRNSTAKTVKQSTPLQTSAKKRPSPLKPVASVEGALRTTPRRNVSKAKMPDLETKSPNQQRVTRGSASVCPPSINIVHGRSPKTLPQQTKGVTPPSQSPSPRKRLLSSPTKSPLNCKAKKTKNNAEIDDSHDDCVPLDAVEKGNGSIVKSEGSDSIIESKVSKSDAPTLNDSDSSLPQLSGRFLRRKWFSLKTRGGFTCLRSAILTPAEIAQEVLRKTMVEPPRDQDANFFSTKLMVRLSSRLPPTRARPSCEELANLINSKELEKKPGASKDVKGEGTAIRVKLERRSFVDTMSHIATKPSKVSEKPLSPTKSPKPNATFSVVRQSGDGSLTKKQERDIALQQLKNLRYL